MHGPNARGRSRGTTVLFVSHNMPAIESLCNRGILLSAGRVKLDGSVSEIIGEYRRQVLALSPTDSTSHFDRPGPERSSPILRSAILLDGDGEPTNYLSLGGTLRLRVGLEVAKPLRFPTIGICFDDTLGQRMLTIHTPVSDAAIEQVSGRCAIECRVDRFPLSPATIGLRSTLQRVLPLTVSNEPCISRLSMVKRLKRAGVTPVESV